MGLYRGLEGGAGFRDAAPVGSGEEVEILGRPGGEVLGGQRGAAGQEESGAVGKAEEQLCQPQLERGESGRFARRRCLGGIMH